MLSVSEALSYDKDAIGIGRKGTIDKPYILKAPFWTVDTLFYAIPREKIDLNFAFDIFQNIDWKKKDESTGVPSLSKTAINEIDVLVPQYFEQQALGEFFNGIDNLITLHQREFAFLCKEKSKKFRYIKNAWEQRKFYELYEKVSRKNDLTYGKNDIISVANMYFKSDSYITDESYLLTYNIFELGDIAFEGNKSKNYAHGRFVENTIGNGIVSHVFDVFRPIMKPYDLLFWKYAINNEKLMGNILLRSTKASTMMTNLVANDFLQEEFSVPTYAEQKKIGAFFQQLDNLITLHQRKPNFYTGGYYAE